MSVGKEEAEFPHLQVQMERRSKTGLSPGHRGFPGSPHVDPQTPYELLSPSPPLALAPFHGQKTLWMLGTELLQATLVGTICLLQWLVIVISQT